MKYAQKKYLWLFISNNVVIAARFKGEQTLFFKQISLASGVIQQGSVINSEAFKGALGDLLVDQKIKEAPTILLFSEQHVFQQMIPLQEKGGMKADEILAKAQELFPIDLSTTYVDIIQGKEFIEFGAIAKTTLQSYLELLKQMGLDVIQVNGPRTFLQTKKEAINLLPPDQKKILGRKGLRPKIAFVFTLIFVFFSYFVFTQAIEWANDYSDYTVSQKNLLATQGLVESSYNKGILMEYFQSTQLDQQKQSILVKRLDFKGLIELVEGLEMEEVGLMEVRILQVPGQSIPTIKLTMLSQNREATEVFHQSLKDNPFFSQVDLPLSFFSKKGESVIEVELFPNPVALTEL